MRHGAARPSGQRERIGQFAFVRHPVQAEPVPAADPTPRPDRDDFSAAGLLAHAG
jgi:hypothetical protein